MLVEIHPDNPNGRQVAQIADILKKGGIIIYPTDTVYGLGCDIYNHKAIERIARIKGVKPEKANFSIICNNLSHISDFTKHLNNNVYKVMKRYLPGPFTFILPANNSVPKLLKSKRKTIGIRVPNNNIPLAIIRELGNPIITTSIHDTDKLLDYTTDPEVIHENFENIVDAVIDGGYGNNIPSTVLDCTNNEIEILRQGLGEFEN